MIARDDAERLDAADPLAPFRERFAIPDPGLIYMDGNSLGRPPRLALRRLKAAAHEEWGEGLVRSWERWVDVPREAGDVLGTELLGARPGEVVLSDQTSVNLYKLAAAALGARPGRTAIVTDSTNFPSDRYVLEGLTGELRVVDADPVHGPQPGDVAAALDGEVALVSLSHVGYKSGVIADMAAITAAAHAAGALVLWDLSHAAGIVPIDLGGTGADLAVGCTYKYLNGGPGAPAFLYVRRELQGELHQPIRGWFGHADMFAFADGYDAAPDIRRFTTGTPPMLAVRAAQAGIETSAEAGIGAIRAKSMSLTALLVDLFDAQLAPLGFELGTPRDPARRGGHVSIRHPDAAAICKRLIADHQVVPDFRPPDTIRLGPAPLYTTHAEVWDAVERLATVAHAGPGGGG